MAKKGIRGQELADEILRVSDNLEGEFRREFLNAVSELAENKELKKLLAEIDSGNFNTGDSIDTRLRSVTIDTSKLDAISRKAMGSAARISGKTVSALKPAFNVTNPSVISVARKMSIDLSTNLTKSTKEVLRNIIQNAVEGNISRVQASKQIRQYVGLLPAHKSAVDKYLDSMIQNGVKPALAQKRADKYAQRLLKYRSETISRTEVARAVGEGQTAMWKQMRDDSLLPPEAKRVWITGYDERVCAICGPMDGVEADIDGFWTTSRGMSEYPSQTHPNCRCTSGIVISKPSTKKSKLKKVDEIEYAHWLIKHQSGKHSQKLHAGGKKANVKIKEKKTDSTTYKKLSDSDFAKLVSAQEKIDMTLEQELVMKGYAGMEYEGINQHLRGKKVGFANASAEASEMYRKKVEREANEMVDLYDKISVPMQTNTTVFRGLDMPSSKEFKVGSRFTDKGFSSTSTESSEATGFATGFNPKNLRKNPTLLEIRIPKGHKVVPMGDRLTNYTQENEILLKNGTKFRVVEVSKARTADGIAQRVTVEVIGD
jgi:hypothetical protein